MLRYTKKETNGEMKEGQEEARELSARNYGRDVLHVCACHSRGRAGAARGTARAQPAEHRRLVRHLVAALIAHAHAHKGGVRLMT